VRDGRGDDRLVERDQEHRQHQDVHQGKLLPERQRRAEGDEGTVGAAGVDTVTPI
jgi:hypothetical protein